MHRILGRRLRYMRETRIRITNIHTIILILERLKRYITNLEKSSTNHQEEFENKIRYFETVGIHENEEIMIQQGEYLNEAPEELGDERGNINVKKNWRVKDESWE